MKCANCKAEIPNNSRFCLNCGAAQTGAGLEQTRLISAGQTTGAADGGREPGNALLDSDIDYEARDRYDVGGRGMSCLAIPIFIFMGLLMLIPGVPILAFFGIPAAIIFTPLTYGNVGQLQDKIRATRIINRLPGFKQGTRVALTASVFLYLTAGSIISILILIVQSHPH